MATSIVRFSAETYVEEPGDLWTSGLRAGWRDEALRLAPAGDGDTVRWVHPDGRPLGELDEPSQRPESGTTAEHLLAALDAEAVTGAVLYPSVAARAYGIYADTELLSAVLDAYNEWALSLAADAPDRLRPVVLLNVDEPAGAVREMRRLADRGAAGFVLPAAPGRGHRYDQRRYEPFWRAAADLGRPLSLLVGSGRAGTAQGRGAEPTMPTVDATPTTASVLAFHATSVFPARRSLTAMIFAGVFERHPALRVGAVGFGASWAAYAVIRAEEMYEVRPERAGPPTRLPDSVAPAPRPGDGDPVGEAITGDDRTGTRGMALEGVGYHFPPGERFGDHFRRNVFLTFRRDALVADLRDHLGVEGLLWGQGRADRAETAQREEFLAGLAEPDRTTIIRDNAVRLYGFGGGGR